MFSTKSWTGEVMRSVSSLTTEGKQSYGCFAIFNSIFSFVSKLLFLLYL